MVLRFAGKGEESAIALLREHILCRYAGGYVEERKMREKMH